jgi:hypothetical protein
MPTGQAGARRLKLQSFISESSEEMGVSFATCQGALSGRYETQFSRSRLGIFYAYLGLYSAEKCPQGRSCKTPI